MRSLPKSFVHGLLRVEIDRVAESSAHQEAGRAHNNVDGFLRNRDMHRGVEAMFAPARIDAKRQDNELRRSTCSAWVQGHRKVTRGTSFLGASLTCLTLAMFVVVACDDDEQSSSTDTTSTTAPPTTTAPSNLVADVDLSNEVRTAKPWSSARVIEKGSQIEVLFDGGQPNCYPVDVEVTRFSDSEATVTLFQGDRSQWQGVCLAYLREFIVRIDVVPNLPFDAVLVDGAK